MSSTSEYINLLQDIQKVGFISPIDPPENETIYNIDLNNRISEAPEFIGTTEEHLAQFIYFCVDRYYDQIDLFETTCVIQYINAKNESRLYKVPFYNITYKGADKIVFPWVIGYDATKEKGVVQFSIQFYTLEEDKLIYNIQTKPAKTQVFWTLNNGKEEFYNYEITEIQKIWDEINGLKREYELYWYDLSSN